MEKISRGEKKKPICVRYVIKKEKLRKKKREMGPPTAEAVINEPRGCR